jgi:hypothetical protein
MDQRLANQLLNSSTQDVNIVNELINKRGANSYATAFKNAILFGHTESADVLKLLVTHDEGLMAAACANGVSYLSEFPEAANKHNCCVESAIRNYPGIYDALKGSVDNDTAMRCATYQQNKTDIEVFKNAGATNYNECMLVATRMGLNSFVQLFLGYGATNANECLDIVGEHPYYDDIKKTLLGI